MGQESPKELVKAHEKVELEKMAKDAQGKQMGQGCPRRNKWDKGAYKQCNKKKPKIVWVWI